MMMMRTTKVLGDVVEEDRCRRSEVAVARVDDGEVEELQ